MASFKDIIEKEASNNDLDSTLLASLIWLESAGNPLTVRFEPNFYQKYLANADITTLAGYVPKFPPTSTTEKFLRAISYGLCQIMGQTARRLGFKGQYMTELLDPATNIFWGASYLAKCKEIAKDDERKMLLVYNGGADKTYPDLIFKIQADKTYEPIML